VYIILPHERVFIGYAIDCYDVELPLHFLQIEKRVVNCVYLFNKHSARQRNLAPNDIKPTYRLDFIKAFNTPNQPRELKSSASGSLNRKVEEVSKEMFFLSQSKLKSHLFAFDLHFPDGTTHFGLPSRTTSPLIRK